MSIDELKSIYHNNFSLKYLGNNFNEKVGLIALICYIVEKMKSKHPGVTYYEVIYKLGRDYLPDEFIVGLSIVCEDFAYGCKEFPTFGLEDKKIPSKIKEILSNWLPF